MNFQKPCKIQEQFIVHFSLKKKKQTDLRYEMFISNTFKAPWEVICALLIRCMALYLAS